MDSYLKRILPIINYPVVNEALKPVLKLETEEIFFSKMDYYHSLSGGVQTAVSWLHVLWTNNLPPVEWEWRSPFDGFGNMDLELQKRILTAFMDKSSSLPEFNFKRQSN